MLPDQSRNSRGSGFPFVCILHQTFKSNLKWRHTLLLLTFAKAFTCKVFTSEHMFVHYKAKLACFLVWSNIISPRSPVDLQRDIFKK